MDGVHGANGGSLGGACAGGEDLEGGGVRRVGVEGLGEVRMGRQW